jgi:hypothetical protein
MPTKSTPTSVLTMAVLPRGQRHSSRVRIAQLYTACFALDSFRRKTWSDDPGNKMAFLPHWPQPRHLERGELQRIHMRALRQESHLCIEPPSRRATRHHHFEQAKSSQVNTLPKAKSETRSKQNKDMHKLSSVYSERGVPLPVLTSGGE